MREPLAKSILETIERLVRAAGETPAPAPGTLRAELAAVLAGGGAVEHRVVAEWDAYRARHDATVIIGDPELHGALLLELRGTREQLPLTLLAAQRWSERDVVRVDGNTLRVDDVIAAIDFLWADVPIATRLIDMSILRAELERSPVALADHSLQDGVDAFRARHSLLTVDATTAWLRDRGLTLLDLEEMVAQELELAEAARRRIVDDVDAHFSSHRDDYERVEVARVTAADADLARDAAHAVAAGRLPSGVELHVAIVAAHALSADERVLARGAVSPPMRGADGRWRCATIVSRRAVELDTITRAAVEARLAARWLAHARASAVIEWNWGRRRDTDALTAAVRAG
jgi:putative peptide maturation system protein